MGEPDASSILPASSMTHFVRTGGAECVTAGYSGNGIVSRSRVCHSKMVEQWHPILPAYVSGEIVREGHLHSEKFDSFVDFCHLICYTIRQIFQLSAAPWLPVRDLYDISVDFKMSCQISGIALMHN